MADIMRLMPDLEGEEMLFVGGLVKEMTDTQGETFAVAYRAQRRDPTTVLLLTLLGFVILAGVQRFYLGQIAWACSTYSRPGSASSGRSSTW